MCIATYYIQNTPTIWGTQGIYNILYISIKALWLRIIISKNKNENKIIAVQKRNKIENTLLYARTKLVGEIIEDVSTILICLLNTNC